MQFNGVNDKEHQHSLVVSSFLHMHMHQNSMCLWSQALSMNLQHYEEWQFSPPTSLLLSTVYSVWQVPFSLSCVGMYG